MDCRLATIGFIAEYATCEKCGYKACYNGFKALERNCKCPKCGGYLVPDWVKDILDNMPEFKRD